MTLTHTSSVGRWADSGLDFAEPGLSSCSGQTPEVASLPLYWRLHLNRERDTGRTIAEDKYTSFLRLTLFMQTHTRLWSCHCEDTR